MNTSPQSILDFWFEKPGEPDYNRQRACWFEVNPNFDGQIRAQFSAAVDAARAGELKSWSEQPNTALALLILFDQFPRNLYRGEARAFETDPAARALAHHVLQQGWDQGLVPVRRMFVYLPFEHGEDMPDQNESVRLMASLQAYPETEAQLGWAEQHRDVILQFGRFPWRNAALGRTSTPAELAYLKEHGGGG